MAKVLRFAASLVVIIAASVVFADEMPAFPGAEGFGAVAVGGRGGRVIKVTNLDTSGPGSLQAACSAEGPRIVVFDVSGVIPGDVVIEHGNITIAGQSAPGAGITIAGQLRTLLSRERSVDNVVVRFLRVRPPIQEGAGGDAIQFARCDGVILDHVSCSWACDEAIDIYGSKNVTVQWCAIEESSTTGHPKGAHNFGIISGPEGARVSIHHSLFAHHARRSPSIANGPSQFINNVVYDFRDGFVHDNVPNDGGYDLIGNYYIPGPSSEVIRPFCLEDGVSYHISDNYVQGIGLIGDPWAEAAKMSGRADFNGRGVKAEKPFVSNDVTVHSASDAFGMVMGRVGCLPRDAVGKRTLREVALGTGSWGRSDPDDLMEGLKAAAPPADADGDGMSDAWETARGLDPQDASDGAKVMDSGYTAIEEYVNSLADALVAAALAAG